jgi:DNA repair exonuclease SbcCD nuclease subunit
VLYLVKFIHTSDWQIGMKGSGLGEAGPIIRETRIESINNVMNVAEKENVDFILMCGDIFEHNMISQEEVKKVISIFNKYADIQLYLLPGNHDIMGPDCVYERSIFQNVTNLTILDSCNPVDAKDAILLPCPIASKFVTTDITSVIPDVNHTDGIHIGIAHGSLIGKFPVSNEEDIKLPVDSSCIDRAGIDYLALGHWHSFRKYKDKNGTFRIAYSGTHEQTNYNEDSAGQCLLVTIDGKGCIPKIDPIKTGKLTWSTKKFEMDDKSSIIELKTYLESVRNYDMVKVIIEGNLPLDSKNELDKVLEFETTLHKNFKVKMDSLNINTAIGLEDQFDYNDLTLNETELYLKKLLSNEADNEKKRIIAEAISKLRFFAGGD